MPEPFLNLLHRNAVGEKQRGAAMSQIVIAHSAQSVFLQKLRESAGNIIRLDDISDFIDTHIARVIFHIGSPA